MLTDAFLDRFLRDSIADGSGFKPGLQEIVAQAKEANRFRRALLTIAEMGKKEDAEVAREAVQNMKKEDAYDTEIAPLMERIIATCKAHKIALVANFKLDGDLCCTTALLQADHEPSNEQLQAIRLLSPHDGRLTMITTRDKDDKVIRMDAIIG